MPTFHIRWQTPEGERSDWIWAESLRAAESEARFREQRAMMTDEEIMLQYQAQRDWQNMADVVAMKLRHPLMPLWQAIFDPMI